MKSIRFAVGALGALGIGVALGDIPLDIRNSGFDDVSEGRAVNWNYGANFKAKRGEGHNGNGALVWTYTAELDGDASAKNFAWQDVGPLKAGKIYVATVSVRPTDVKVVMPNGQFRNGIGLRLNCYNAAGKRIQRFQAYPLPSGTADWTTVRLVTRTMPEGVANARIELYASNCTAGMAALDQVCLAEKEQLPVESVHTSAYRDEAVEGPVTFGAMLNYGENTKPSDCEAYFSFVGRDGGVKRVKAAVMTKYGAKVTLDVGAFAYGTNTVSCELVKGGKVLGKSGMAFAHLRNPVRRRVYMDRYGRLVVDGKPTFLMGMCWDNLPINDKTLKHYTEAEFNVLGSYAPKSRAELDLIWKYGLYAMIRATDGYNDPDHGLKQAAELVERTKDHPATVIIDINDEQPVTNQKWVRARKNLVWKIDPDHPTLGAQCYALDAREHMGGYDILNCDPYPVGGLFTDCNEQNTYGVMRVIREHLERNLALKPAIHTPQYFSWAWFITMPRLHQNRSPSPTEMANMSWQMIALGANGLLGYSFKYLHYKNRDKVRPYEKGEYYWPVIKAIVHDIRRYEDVILSVEPAPAIVSGNADPFAARVWRKDGDVYLLVASGVDRKTTAAIRLSEPVGKVVDWDFCLKPTVKGDTVTFNFPPSGFGMVRLGKTQAK